MDDFLVLEEHVLRPADAAGELTFDRGLRIDVISNIAARGVYVEVHFGVVVAAHEERGEWHPRMLRQKAAQDDPIEVLVGDQSRHSGAGSVELEPCTM